MNLKIENKSLFLIKIILVDLRKLCADGMKTNACIIEFSFFFSVSCCTDKLQTLIA